MEGEKNLYEGISGSQKGGECQKATTGCLKKQRRISFFTARGGRGCTLVNRMGKEEPGKLMKRSRAKVVELSRDRKGTPWK